MYILVKFSFKNKEKHKKQIYFYYKNWNSYLKHGDENGSECLDTVGQILYFGARNYLLQRWVCLEFVPVVIEITFDRYRNKYFTYLYIS